MLKFFIIGSIVLILVGFLIFRRRKGGDKRSMLDMLDGDEFDLD